MLPPKPVAPPPDRLTPARPGGFPAPLRTIPKSETSPYFGQGYLTGKNAMRGIRFAIVIVALGPSHVLAQDYANATNAAWCAGALGAYALSSNADTDLERARSRHSAVAREFFGTTADQGATVMIFENLGREGAAACNQTCASQQKKNAREACFNSSPDCKRIIACLAN